MSCSVCQPLSSSGSRTQLPAQLVQSYAARLQQRGGRRMRVPLAAAAAPAGIATAAAAAAAVAAMCIRKELKPSVQGQSTPWNSAILSLCPSLTAPYRLPALLNNGHVVSPAGLLACG